jgi:hypothetical protein
MSRSSWTFGWSWRDLKIGVTTEQELLKFGGLREKVLLPPDYLDLKQGKPYSVEFIYEDSDQKREEVRRIESTGGSGWHGPVILSPPFLRSRSPFLPSKHHTSRNLQSTFLTQDKKRGIK